MRVSLGVRSPSSAIPQEWRGSASGVAVNPACRLVNVLLSSVLFDQRDSFISREFEMHERFWGRFRRTVTKFANRNIPKNMPMARIRMVLLT